MFEGPIEHTPEMCAILDHPSILGLIGGVLGEDFNYCNGNGNYLAVTLIGVQMEVGDNFLPPRQLSI